MIFPFHCTFWFLFQNNVCLFIILTSKCIYYFLPKVKQEKKECDIVNQVSKMIFPFVLHAQQTRIYFDLNVLFNYKLRSWPPFLLVTKMCHYVVNDNSDDKPMKYGDGRKILMRNSVNHFLFERPQNIESHFDIRIFFRFN